MECKHSKLKSVNCTVICCECGAVLPPDALRKQPEEEPQKPSRKKAKKEDKQHDADIDP